jgi:hypothetical protein
MLELFGICAKSASIHKPGVVAAKWEKFFVTKVRKRLKFELSFSEPVEELVSRERGRSSTHCGGDA